MGDGEKITPGTRAERAAPPMDPKDAARIAAAPFGPDNDEKGGKPGVGDRFEFDLDWNDRRGFRWTGKFRGHVLTNKERIQVGLTKARLSGGVPYASLDGATQSLLEMQAHLAIAIDSAPEWWKPNDHRDPNLLNAVYQEVDTRELTFWEPPPK